MSQRTKTIIIFELFSTKNLSGHIEFDFGEHSDRILLELGSNWEQGAKEILRSKISSKLSISKKILLERYFSRLANQLKFFCLLSENKHVCYWVLLNKINLWPRRIFFGNTTTPKIRNILRKNRKHRKIHRNCFGKWYAVLTAWLKIFPAEDEFFKQNCFFQIGKQSFHFCIFSNRTIYLDSLNPVLTASANKFPRKDQNFSNKFWKFFYKVVFSPKKTPRTFGTSKIQFWQLGQKIFQAGTKFFRKNSESFQ